MRKFILVVVSTLAIFVYIQSLYATEINSDWVLVCNNSISEYRYKDNLVACSSNFFVFNLKSKILNNIKVDSGIQLLCPNANNVYIIDKNNNLFRYNNLTTEIEPIKVLLPKGTMISKVKVFSEKLLIVYYSISTNDINLIGEDAPVNYGILCIDPIKNSLIWNNNVKSAEYILLGIMDGDNILTSIGKSLYALNENNGVMKKIRDYNNEITNISMVNNNYYLSGKGMRFIKLVKRKQLWNKYIKTSDNNYYISELTTPVNINNMMVFPTTRGEIFGSGVGNGNSAWSLIFLNDETGEIVKSIRIQGEVNYPIVLYRKRLYFATQGKYSGLFYMDTKDFKVNKVHYNFGRTVFEPVVYENKLYCISDTGIYEFQN
jgi:hypothetical protein